MISAVVSARLAGLDRIKSGFTSRFANRLPIFGASRLPRSPNGRSLSGNAVSSQLDFAWRMRNSVFMPHPVRPILVPVLFNPRRPQARDCRQRHRPGAAVMAREHWGSWALGGGRPFKLLQDRGQTFRDGLLDGI